jgi:hypothetical protein
LGIVSLADVEELADVRWFSGDVRCEEPRAPVRVARKFSRPDLDSDDTRVSRQT